MTPQEFVIWLKGFVAGSHHYNLTPKGWETVQETLEQVKLEEKKEEDLLITS